jgi:tRNA(fMet)-specific endonuclease VapC
MSRYLLDTDTCIYLLNGNAQVKERVSQEGIEALAIAIPTVSELYFGAYNSARVEANVERVRTFLSPPCPRVLLLDESAAEHFGRDKALLRREGRPIGDMDLLIAAIARHHGLTVVTNNTAHFERLSGLILENWLEPPHESR